MEDEGIATFLGLDQGEGDVDIAILSLPYELTTSYGQGTAEGPRACLEASTQVELYDEHLGEDLPAGFPFIRFQNGMDMNPPLQQLDSMAGYLVPWFKGDCFPVVLGGEHGILPSIMEATRHHPLVNNDLSNLTVVQIDAHGDLREELDGEIYSHACRQLVHWMLESDHCSKLASVPSAKRNMSECEQMSGLRPSLPKIHNRPAMGQGIGQHGLKHSLRLPGLFTLPSTSMASMVRLSLPRERPFPEASHFGKSKRPFRRCLMHQMQRSSVRMSMKSGFNKIPH